MDPQQVVVKISGQDETSPAFLSAQRNLQNFNSQTQLSGVNMREARGAAKLFSDEVGIGLNRNLIGAIANSAVLGPALQAAFPIAAAIAFGAVIWETGQKLADLYNDAKGATEFLERQKEATAELTKSWAAADRFNKETGEVGVSAQGKYKARLTEATAELTKQQKTVRDLSDSIYGLQHGLTPSSGGNTAKDVPTLQLHYQQAIAKEGELTAQVANIEKNFHDAQKKGWEEANKLAEKHQQLLDAMRAKYKPQLEGMVEWGHPKMKLMSSPYPGLMDPGAMLGPNAPGQLEPDQAVADRNLQRIKDLSSLYDSTRNAAERYGIEVKALDAQFGSQKNTDAYKRALMQLDQQYRQGDYYAMQLGRDIGDAFREGVLEGRNWDAVLRHLLVSIGEMILKAELLKALQGTIDKGGFWGSFATGITGAFSGRASGGDVAAGGSYIVGERGPELFVPNVSGSIIPHGASGIVQHFDMRGSVVTSDLVRRAELAGAMRATHAAAVQTSVGSVRERALRGIQ